MNYPNGIKKNTLSIKQKQSYKNRGMDLESDINLTNNYYIDKDKAFIYKKPTPIKLVKVDYKMRKINEAYFDMPSTTDYNGIYNGKYIDFEAKETISTKGFPIANIHIHQINHLKNIIKAKGICFLIVRFTKLNETFLLMGKDFINYIDNNKKSIVPIDYFKEKGYLIKEKYNPRIDYLSIIDKVEEL